MKVEIKKEEESKIILNIEIPKEIVQKEEEVIYAKLTKNAVIPGFRQGKVPRKILSLRYKDEINSQLISNLISSTYSSVLKDKNLFPIGETRIEAIDFKEDKSLFFRAIIEVKPEIKLASYKEIKLEKIIFEITKNKVDEALQLLQDQKATLEDINNRNVKEGDYVIIDYEGFVDNQQVAREKGTNQYLQVGSPNIERAFTEGLMNASLNEEKEIKVKLPINYPLEKLRGKECIYKLKIKAIKEKKLPQLNDEFAKSFKKSNLEELKQAVKEELIKEYKEISSYDLERQLIEYLVKNSYLELPLSLVKEEKKNLEERKIKLLKMLGQSQEEIDKNIENSQQELEEMAKRNIKIYFILHQIKEEEKISVSTQEIEEKINFLVNKTKKKKEEIKEKYFSSLKGKILYSKIIKHLINLAKIKEVNKKV